MAKGKGMYTNEADIHPFWGEKYTVQSADYYALIRSCMETCHRNRINEFDALQRLTAGRLYTGCGNISFESKLRFFFAERKRSGILKFPDHLSIATGYE